MTAIQMLTEPKNTRMASEKGILNDQNFSETVKDEFHKVLNNVNDNYNTYEKRLEKLQDNNLPDRSSDFYNFDRDYNQNYADKSQSRKEPEQFERRNEQTQNPDRNANEYSRQSDENSRVVNNQYSTENTRQELKEIKTEDKNEKVGARENSQSNSNQDSDTELKSKIQMANTVATGTKETINTQNPHQKEAAKAEKESAQNKKEIIQDKKEYIKTEFQQNIIESAKNQTELDKKEVIQDKKEYIKNNFIQGMKETSPDKNSSQAQNMAHQAIVAETAKGNAGNLQQQKPNNTQNQEARLAHLKAQPQNQIKTGENSTETIQQAEKKVVNSNINPNSVKTQTQQVNAQENPHKPEETENPQATNPNNQAKQSISSDKNLLNQGKVQNEVKTELRINDQANTLKQEQAKNLQQAEIKINGEAKPQKEQEELSKIDINKHQNQLPYVDNKNLQDKTKAGHSINENIKYADAKDKAVITKLELQNNSAESQLNKKDNQQQSGESISKVNNQQSPGNSTEINTQRTMQFDRILDSKDTRQTLSSSVMDQIVKKASAELSPNKSEVTISLRPDNLGKVDINIVSKNGVLTAQITAENNQVKDILNKGLETLRQNLSDQGVNVNRLVVNVQESHTSNNNQANQHQDQNFQKFDQPSQGSMNSNPNSHSSKQTAHQEKANNYTNNLEIEEEINPNLVTNNNSGPVMQGRVDYRV